MQDQFNYLLVSSDPVITSIIEFDISQLLRDVSEGEASGIQMTMMTMIPCRVRICGQVVSVGRSTGDSLTFAVTHVPAYRFHFAYHLVRCLWVIIRKNEEA